MLDQVKTAACSRNWHIAGGKGGVLTYVRMNLNYDQTVSMGGLWKATSILAWAQLEGKIVVFPWNSLPL